MVRERSRIVFSCMSPFAVLLVIPTLLVRNEQKHRALPLRSWLLLSKKLLVWREGRILALKLQ